MTVESAFCALLDDLKYGMAVESKDSSKIINRHSCLGDREEDDMPNLMSDSRLLPIKGPCFLSVHSVVYHLPMS